jgi:Spy/CpxP family protein refolding chaperone
MRRTLLVAAAVVIAMTAGIALVAQHRQAGVSESGDPFAIFHHACLTGDTAGAGLADHVRKQLAPALDLTAAQVADVERIAGEACTAMRKIHESMMNVLTPDQQRKLQDLHSSGHGTSGLHDLMKKLHGGR